MIKVDYDYIRTSNIKENVRNGEDPDAHLNIDMHMNIEGVKVLKNAAEAQIKAAAESADYRTIIALAETLKEIADAEDYYNEAVTSAKEELKEEAKEAEEGETEE
jgi:regulator of RNase E activity RraB